MCRYLFVALLLSTVPALAEDKPTKEPAALIKARATYDAKVKAAVDPIKAAYLKHLDGMMKEYGAAGDLESAQAVQKEIKSLNLTGNNRDILLAAKTATIHGNKLSCAQDEDGPGCLIGWTDAQDWASWEFRAVPKVAYDLSINYGCHPGTAGSVCEIKILSPTGKALMSTTMTVKPTGKEWETYITVPLGQVRFDGPGPYTLTLKAIQKPSGWVMNVKGLSLTPKKPAASHGRP